MGKEDNPAPEDEHPPSHSSPDGFSAQSSLAETVFMPVTHPGHFTRVRGMGGSPEPERVGSLLIRIDRRRRCPPGGESRRVWRISRAWINHRPPDAPQTCLMSIEVAIRLRGRTAWSVGKPPAGGGKGASVTERTEHTQPALSAMKVVKIIIQSVAIPGHQSVSHTKERFTTAPDWSMKQHIHFFAAELDPKFDQPKHVHEPRPTDTGNPSVSLYM